jgi:cobalamin biosynthesis Mg chelatase CobN
MGGRPRVDVLCNMSGIFRDSFQNVLELLDDLFQRAAAADEPIEKNFIRYMLLFFHGNNVISPYQKWSDMAAALHATSMSLHGPPPTASCSRD